MKHKLILGIAIFLILGITSCKKNSNPVDNSNNPATTIFPLSVGNEWIVQVINFDTTGSIYYTDLDTIRILRDTTIQSEKWYMGYGIITNRSDGLYDFEAGTTNEMSLVYKFPATVNYEYTYRGTPMIVLGISDTVSVFAGNYVCYHYREGITGVSYTDRYYAPNIGFVKADCYNPLASGGVYKYLSYSLIKVVLK
jgi:hypothetical protein